MVTSDTPATTPVRCLVVRPNRSSTWRQSLVFLGAVAVPLVVVAVTLAWWGYWLVLPFAGLELGALFTSLYVVAQAGRRCQVISIGPTAVIVEKGRQRRAGATGGGPEHRLEFTRGWVRIELEPAAGTRQPSRLWIGAPGRRVEIGEFLIDGEKAALAARLRSLLERQPVGSVAS